MDELLRKKAGRIRKEKVAKAVEKEEKTLKEAEGYKKTNETQMEEISWEEADATKQKMVPVTVRQKGKKKVKSTVAKSPKPAKLVTFKKKRHLL